MLGLEIKFTNEIKEFVAYEGAKFSYGKEQLGNEVFIQNVDLLYEQGINDLEIRISQWEEVPCFFMVSENSAVPFDIFAASFYLLSRYEEYLPHVKNTEGRFPASESIGYAADFLHTPVVDIWARKFQQLLKQKFPDLEFKLQAYSTVNLITVSQIFKYRKKGFARILVGILKDLFKLDFKMLKERILILFNLREDPYNVFEELIRFYKKYKIKLHFMFQLSDFSTYDRNINHKRKFYKTLIKFVGDYCNVGLKIGFYAKDDLKVLKKEKARLEHILNRPVLSMINNQFNLLLPDGYNFMAELEIREDFSMGYPETAGFRAGTCSSFMFYDLNFEITTPLLIQPYMINTKNSAAEDFSDFQKITESLISEVKAVGGRFCSVFNNEDFATPEKKEQNFQLIRMINEGAQD